MSDPAVRALLLTCVALKPSTRIATFFRGRGRSAYLEHCRGVPPRGCAAARSAGIWSAGLGEGEIECEPEFLCGRDATRALALGRLRLCGVHSDLDCEPRVERRRRHVRHRVRLVDHQPGRQSDDRVPGSGRRQPAAVPVHSAGRRLGGRHRFSAIADRGRTRDSGRLRDFCRPRFAEARNADALVGDDLLAWA